MSPDVFDMEGLKPHYSFPVAAISSITNRMTGLTLSGELMLLSLVAYFGDVGAFLNAIKAFTPLLVTAKLAVAFPATYHFLAAVRHFYWDYGKHSSMAEKDSSVDLDHVGSSSYAVLYGSLGIAAVLALYSSK